MAGLNRLSARFVETITEPKRHADGGNLYLAVTPAGSKSWVFMYRLAGRQREMGLGRAGKAHEGGVTLAAAREAAGPLRASLAAGRDPMEDRGRSAAAPTFGKVADDLIAAKREGWINAAHARQWVRTLEVDAAALRPLPVDAIRTDDVLAVLQPIWSTKQETASKLRGRIEAVLDAAKARGLRSGDNPAAWRGNLKSLLSARRKLQRGHHKAMSYADVPAFVARLRRLSSVSARATEFAVATAARSAEVLGARWEEIDLDAGTWTVPASRMKGGKREHRKPLSPHAMLVLRAMEAVRHSDFVFPGAKADKPLSGMALEMTLRRLKVDATPHGFRSSFKDWAAEETSFPNIVSEMQLAHDIGNEVERAYRRGDLFDKRRALMNEWSTFCTRSENKSSSL